MSALLDTMNNNLSNIIIDESELDNGFIADEIFSNAECLGHIINK